MAAKDKKQCQLRFYTDTYDKIKNKLDADGINYQQLGDLLFGAYLKNNREVTRLIKQFTENKKGKRKRNQLSEREKDDLFRLIELEHSPLRKFEETTDEQ